MGNARDCPLKDEEIQARVVFDMVYDPVETHLLQVARPKGLPVIPGVGNFVQQPPGSLKSGLASRLRGDMPARGHNRAQDRAAAQTQRNPKG